MWQSKPKGESNESVQVLRNTCCFPDGSGKQGSHPLLQRRHVRGQAAQGGGATRTPGSRSRQPLQLQSAERQGLRQDDSSPLLPL